MRRLPPQLRRVPAARLLWIHSHAAARNWPPAAYRAVAQVFSEAGNYDAARRWRTLALLAEGNHGRR